MGFFAFLNATFNMTEKEEVDEDMPGLLLSKQLKMKHPIVMIPGIVTWQMGDGKQETRTVDGRNPAPADRSSLSHRLQGFIDPMWCRFSSINSMKHCFRVCRVFLYFACFWGLSARMFVIRA